MKNLSNKLMNAIYKIGYNFRPLLVLKKVLKSLLASEMIFRDQISYYPPQVTKLEKAFKSLTGKKYALTFCNGTSSLEAAIFAINTRFGSRKTIVVPSMNFHADLDAIINAGFKIKFIDVSQNSVVPSLSEVAEAVDDDTACVILCHLFGHHIETAKIAEFLSSRNVTFIEDCSHAHCSNANNNIAKYCDIAFFSMQGAKAVAAGEGGVCVTNEKEFFVRMSAYSHFGRHDDMFSNELSELIGTGIGHKHRMAPIGAVFALTDIKFLNLQNKIIEINSTKLVNIIRKNVNVKVIDAQNGATGRFGGLPILIKDIKKLDKIKYILDEYGINYSDYPFLLHHNLSRYNGDLRGKFPNTENFAKVGLMLNRRYLEFLPFFQKIQFIKAFEKIGNL
jgi:dTDP-4-amino-4,6-dideoxygalactose transaminase